MLNETWDDNQVRRMLKGDEDLPFQGGGSANFIGETIKNVPAQLKTMLRHLLRRNPVLRMTIDDVSLLPRGTFLSRKIFCHFMGNLCLSCSSQHVLCDAHIRGREGRSTNARAQAACGEAGICSCMLLAGILCCCT